MKLIKIIYVPVIRECGEFDISFECRKDAEEWLKFGLELDPPVEYDIVRISYYPRKCDKCGHYEMLTVVEEDHPLKMCHYECPKCGRKFGD
jgi:hypothetical protein